MEKKSSLKAVSTNEAPAAIGPYSQGVVAGDLLFISGQLALDPRTGEFVEGDILSMTHRVIRNVQAIAESVGSGLDRVVKTTIFLADMNDFAAVNEVYSQYFKGVLPARAVVQAAALPKGGKIEMEAVVHIA
ncbi:MAG: RidA family protein [Desulfatiglandaceae bacterium]|jgi:2-iminobutanoate/2-iminopropanoate deaminase